MTPLASSMSLCSSATDSWRRSNSVRA
jgi:hypothetical protein